MPVAVRPRAVRPAAPTSRPDGRRRRTVALGLLVSAQFVVMLDTAIVNVEDNNGNTLITVSGDVDCGNHQAHSQ